MICFPNAKINLGLHITEKRPDGFHNIETVFCPIGWRDVLEVIENGNWRKGTDKISLAVSGIKAGSVKSNLVTKAYHLLAQQAHLPPVKAHLHKTIPVGAGLGGGSSDAAFFINLLNEKFSLNIDLPERKRLAATLGSDCAFFIENKHLFAQGRGDVFSNIAVDLGDLFLVVVYPAIHSNTAEAYKGVVPCTPANDLRKVLAQPIAQWKDNLVNDFEKTLFYRYPELDNIKHKFYEQGARYASMSGSGSAVYALFEQEQDVKAFGFPAKYLVWQS